MPLRVATDPAYRGRGIFAELEARNEERVRDLGIRLLLTVPNAASAPVFLNKLGWKPLPPLRVWARAAPPPPRAARQGGRAVRRGPDRLPGRARPRAARLRLAQLAFCRLADAVRARRGRGIRASRGAVGATASSRPSRASSCRTRVPRAGARVVIAAPPPWQYRRYIFGGYVPDPPHVHGARQGARCRPADPRTAALRARRPRLPMKAHHLRHPGRRPGGSEPRSAVVGMLRALAERVDEVVVLADRAVEGALPGQLPCPHLRRGLEERAAAAASSPG